MGLKLKRYWMILLIWIGTFFGLQAPIEAQTGKDQMTVIVEIEGILMNERNTLKLIILLFR